MAASTTELIVRLKADATGFAAELGSATQNVDALHAKAQALGTAMQDVGRRMTLGFTVPFVAGMGLAVKAASDLEEAQNKVDVVFAESAGNIKRWASDSAQAFGLSKAAAYEAVGTFGNLFRSMDIGLPTAAKMSKQLVELAADLASFNNANPEEVLIALRSGLVGEIEPLRKFGVSLSQARVEAKAMELGLWDGVGAIDAASKAQAAYAIILEDTTLAQGDFARTSDSAANQVRIAKAELTDAAASIGQVVLPMFADLVGFLADIASWFADLPKPVQSFIVALGGLVAAAGPVLWVTGSMLRNLEALDRMLGTNLVGSLGVSAGAIGAWVLVAAGVAGIIYGITNASDLLSGSLDISAQAWMGLTDAQMINAVQQVIALKGMDGLIQLIREVAAVSTTTATAIVDASGVQGAARDRLLRIIEQEEQATFRATERARADAAAKQSVADAAYRAAEGINAMNQANARSIIAGGFNPSGGEYYVEGAGAEGAIVNRPTIALIGEAGPEALVPLNRLPGNSPLPGGMGGSLTIPLVLDGRVITEVVVSNLNRAGGPKITQRAVA